MFVRVKRCVQRGKTYEYLQLVESFRHGGKVRQRVLATLGRRDLLEASGGFETLIECMTRFGSKMRTVEQVRGSGVQQGPGRSWGPTLVFSRLWEQQRLPAILERLARERRFRFDVERGVFALVLRELCAPGKGPRGVSWLRTVEGPGLEALMPHHLYRSLEFLATVRPQLEQELRLTTTATPAAGDAGGGPDATPQGPSVAAMRRAGRQLVASLAARLREELIRRLAERRLQHSWAVLVRDLEQVKAVDVELDGARYRLRTDLVGSAHSSFSVVGVRTPPTMSRLTPAPPAPPES